MSEYPYLDKLNVDQYLVATTINGQMLVTAGAGTGKTTAIVSRVAYLIDNDIPASKILLLTFTNKAASEMQSRIRTLVGNTANDITACTFHSFCANFLRKHSKLAGLDSNFTVIDSTDATEVVSLMRENFFEQQKAKGDIVYDYKEFPTAKKIYSAISKSINCDIPIEEVINFKSFGHYEFEVTSIIKLYIQYKKERKLVDYDDLLMYTRYILKKHESIRSKIDNDYAYIMVDEYQDTNKIQDSILDLITQDNNNLVVIGDANQAIYGFRGADVDNILTFEKRHPGCASVALGQNYRSSQEILDAVNAVMRYSSEAPINDLTGQFHGARPAILVSEDNHEECLFIIDNIKQLMEDGVKLNDMAVIFRSAKQSFELELLLAKNDIPFEKFGGMKFFEKKIVKNILSYIRAGISHTDEIALYRLLQFYPGIGSATAKKIAAAVREKGLDELGVIYSKTKYGKTLNEILTVIKHIQPLPIKEQLEYIFPYYNKVAEEAINAKRIDDSRKADELVIKDKEIDEALAILDMIGEYTNARQFLEDMMLEIPVNKQSSDRLNLTTIHSAKGLEYDYVMLMDAIQGITPKTKQGDDEDQEELHCLYVAMTRAKKCLQLYVPRYHTSWQGGTEGTLSHFINNYSIIDKFDTNASYTELERLMFTVL